MVILRSKNKITDFFMILTSDSPFKMQTEKLHQQSELSDCGGS